MDKSEVEILKCNFNTPEHCQAEIDLMRHYMTDAMGGSGPLSDEQNIKLIDGLKNHPTILTFLAKYNGEYVGLTNSFINFGTFAAKPFINIHDVIVKDSCRGLGIGVKLIEANIREANELNCGKVTLEVREDNVVAQNLYKKMGFDECQPKMLFWAKYF